MNFLLAFSEHVISHKIHIGQNLEIIETHDNRDSQILSN